MPALFVLTRRAMGAVLFAGLMLVLLAGAALAQPIAGTYRVEGRNPDGSPYQGSVTVTETDGALGFAWQVGSQSYEGQGQREGAVVRVDWGARYPVVYVVMPDGELHGTWSNGQALERLIP